MTADLTTHAILTIRAGSKSFALASRLFAPDIRRSAVMLYAWCRHCDDLIDGQQLGQQLGPQALARDPGAGQRQLNELQQEVRRAYAGEPMSRPAFGAFQAVVLEHPIPQRLPMAHLAGFAMDVRGRTYETLDDTLDYCYHVAGVVGLMMALITGARDRLTLDRACDLGLAFQLTNIARDIVEDAAMGRCYLPAQWLRDAGIAPTEIADRRHRTTLATLAARLIDLAEPYYHSAQGGLAALPFRSAWAIATALIVYREIGIRVRALGAAAWDGRVSTGRLTKSRMLVQALGLTLRSRRLRPAKRPEHLWQRPHRDDSLGHS